MLAYYAYAYTVIMLGDNRDRTSRILAPLLSSITHQNPYPPPMFMLSGIGAGIWALYDKGLLLADSPQLMLGRWYCRAAGANALDARTVLAAGTAT